jgi:2-oxoglutarate ferredoxin oxidoreductase subunit beta
MIQATLGFTNISFVARTVDWNPLHLYQTLKTAFDHKGMSFVQILQRCPTYTDTMFLELQRNPDRIALLEHERGVPVDDAVGRIFKNHVEHDPSNLDRARELAGETERIPIGLFYHNPDAPRYDTYTAAGLDMDTEQRLEALDRELDRFAI